MKYYLAIISAFMFATVQTMAQSFTGEHSSVYDGITTFKYNPAASAWSQNRLQMQFFGIQNDFSNNYLSFKGDFSEALKHFDKDAFLVENLNGQTKKVNFSTEVNAANFLLAIGKNTFYAAPRIRSVLSVENISEEVATTLYNINDSSASSVDWRNLIQDASLHINFITYGELGLGYSRRFDVNDGLSVSAGATAKLLSGGLNGFIKADSLSFAIDTATQSVSAQNTRLQFFASNVLDGGTFQYKPIIRSVGFDAGFSFALKNDKGVWLNGGIAVTDIGWIKSTPSDYSRTFVSNGNYVSLDTLAKFDLSPSTGLDSVLGLFGTVTKPSAEYRTQLPTRLNIHADLKIIRGLRVNVFAGINMVGKKTLSPKLPTTLVVTPCYDSKVFGAYLPITFDNYKIFNAGLAFRIYNVFTIGSSNLASSLVRNELSGINLYGSVGFGINKAKPKKKPKSDNK